MTIGMASRRGDHVCRLVRGSDEFRVAAVEFLAAGLDRGERLMYVGDRSTAELTADLQPLGDIDRLMASGGLRVESTQGAYAHDEGFDAEGQVARYRALTEAALHDGFEGLRVAADATALVATDDARRRFVGYELAVDGLMASSPMSALCAYDISALGAAAAELCAVHPTNDAPEDLAPGFRLSFGPAGLELAGEVDIANCALFAVALDAAAACGDPCLVIDASRLTFVDVSGLVTLAELRRSLVADGRDLRLLHAPPVAARCASHLNLDLLLFAPPKASP